MIWRYFVCSVIVALPAIIVMMTDCFALIEIVFELVFSMRLQQLIYHVFHEFTRAQHSSFYYFELCQVICLTAITNQQPTY